LAMLYLAGLASLSLVLFALTAVCLSDYIIEKEPLVNKFISVPSDGGEIRAFYLHSRTSWYLCENWQERVYLNEMLGGIVRLSSAM